MIDKFDFCLDQKENYLSKINMEHLSISSATPDERIWAANLLSGTDPWLTLGIKPEKISESCNDPQYLIYIAHYKETACGVIIIHPHGVAGSPYIKSIAIMDEFRSRGVGANLIKFAEELFRPTSRYLFLCVSSFNARARAFYDKLGYTIVGELKDYIIDGAAEILLSKRLT